MSDRRAIDRRAAKTRNRIADAIMNLRRDGTFDHLTVGELTAAAGISRSTFYAHFASLSDYLERSFGNMVEGHARAAAQSSAARNPLLTVTSILAHVAAAPNHVAAISSSKYRPSMLAEGERRLALIIDERLREIRPELASAGRNAVATFVASGFIGLLRNWMESGMVRAVGDIEADFNRLANAVAAIARN